MRRLALTHISLLAFLACDGEPTALGTAPTADPAFGVVAGASGCYSVDINFAVSGLSPSFSGVATGDVEADVDVFFDGTDVFHGVSVGTSGIVTWDVTGGIIPELVGQVFQTRTNDVVLQNTGDATPLIFSINATDKAIGGVAKANLTGTGTIDVRDLAPPFEVTLNYDGVICP